MGRNRQVFGLRTVLTGERRSKRMHRATGARGPPSPPPAPSPNPGRGGVRRGHDTFDIGTPSPNPGRGGWGGEGRVFGDYDFGLTQEQEERAKRMHAESIIIDTLFQGPCGYRSFTDEMLA